MKDTKKPGDLKKKLFEINTVEDLTECFDVLNHYVSKGKAIHVQIVSKNKFKFEVIRAAYFAYLTDFTKSSKGDGRSVQDIHVQLKSDFLIPILCREYDWFADLTLAAVDNNAAKLSQEKLISIADGSIVTSELLMEHFKASQEWIKEMYEF